MASKKTFIESLDDLDNSPTAKYISKVNQDIKETKEETEKPNSEEQQATTQTQPEATPKQHPNKKDPNVVRGQRFSLLLTIPQRESLEHIARVKSISVNELIGQFINAGIENSKTELEQWEQLKEVLGL